jgi:hypothetical protein
MVESRAPEMTATDRAARSGTDVRASTPVRTALAPRRKWSARRTLVFVVLASACLWALIIALFLRS